MSDAECSTDTKAGRPHLRGSPFFIAGQQALPRKLGHVVVFVGVERFLQLAVRLSISLSQQQGRLGLDVARFWFHQPSQRLGVNVSQS